MAWEIFHHPKCGKVFTLICDNCGVKLYTTATKWRSAKANGKRKGWWFTRNGYQYCKLCEREIPA